MALHRPDAPLIAAEAARIEAQGEEVERYRTALEAWQKWEAGFLLDDAVWPPCGGPVWTEAQYNAYIEVQGKREQALALAPQAEGRES